MMVSVSVSLPCGHFLHNTVAVPGPIMPENYLRSMNIAETELVRWLETQASAHVCPDPV